MPKIAQFDIIQASFRIMVDTLKERAAVNVHKPYKPRKLKMDTYHRLMREARKKKPKNSLNDAKHKRAREAYLRKNGRLLKQRRQVVRERRKQMGLD